MIIQNGLNIYRFYTQKAGHPQSPITTVSTSWQNLEESYAWYKLYLSSEEDQNISWCLGDVDL